MIEAPDIRYRDSLSEGASEDAEKYTLIPANPPFAGSLDHESTARDLQRIVKTKKSELLVLVRLRGAEEHSVGHDDDREPVFCHALFRTPVVRRRIGRLSSGTGGSMKNVARAKFEAMPVPKVGTERQADFASRSQCISAQRAGVMGALAADDELFASLQSRAFRGEL